MRELKVNKKLKKKIVGRGYKNSIMNGFKQK